jgi:hypothetical protein
MMNTYTPLELDFTNSDLPVEARHEAITTMLHKYECIVDFVKVNGELRSMPCTLMDEFMPAASQILKEDVTDVPPNQGVITVWGTDAQGWRAMRTMNITKVQIAPKKWIVTVEEDPETGELILPFPEDFLEQAGWKEGDTLEWNEEDNSSWSLKKKSEE